jgi:DNA-binding PadR family transcriptional regulator
MGSLSDDEEAVLLFLHDQPREQATHVQATHDNRYLRAEMKENPDAIRDVLERLADRGCVEPLPGGFSRERTTYAYRLTEQGEQALAGS